MSIFTHIGYTLAFWFITGNRYFNSASKVCTIFLLYCSSMCLFSISTAQNLVLKDEFSNVNTTSIKDIEIDENGDRYYILDLAPDVWKINGNEYNIRNESMRPASADRSYILVISDLMAQIQITYPGGYSMEFTDTSFVVFHSHRVDSLASADTILVSPFTDSLVNLESNFSIWNRDRLGNLLWAKIWPQQYASNFNPKDLRINDNTFYIASQYQLSTDSIVVDSILLYGRSEYKVNLAQLSNELVFYYDIPFINDNSCENISFDIANNMIFGSLGCNSSEVLFCSDVIENRAIFQWQSAMPIWFTTDPDLECTRFKTADFDASFVVPDDVLILENSLISVGTFASSYFAIDDDTLFANATLHDGFLAIMNENLECKHLLSLENTDGYSSFLDLALIDNHTFLLGGICGSDNFTFGNQVIDTSLDSFGITGFIAVIDTSANISNILTFEGYDVDFVVGEDNENYVFIRSEGEAKLYLIDNISAIEPVSRSQDTKSIEWQLFPSVLNVGEIVTITLSREVIRNYSKASVGIYSVSGDLLFYDYFTDSSFNFRLPQNLNPGMYVVKLNLDSKHLSSKKILVIN